MNKPRRSRRLATPSVSIVAWGDSYWVTVAVLGAPARSVGFFRTANEAHAVFSTLLVAPAAALRAIYADRAEFPVSDRQTDVTSAIQKAHTFVARESLAAARAS